MTTLDDITVRRFWQKVDKGGPNGCWIWTGAHWAFGHGAVSIKRKLYGAHRLSWQMANGDIPEGGNILHTCDNPPCVNPDHLYVGTLKDNSRDMVQRGRIGIRKLTWADVQDARRRARTGEPIKSIAIDMALPYGAIHAAVRGESFAYLPGAVLAVPRRRKRAYKKRAA